MRASPDELSFLQSTTMGENLVLQALGFPQMGARIVTDVLHFFGSFYTYGELGKAGMDVVTLPMTPEGRIDMAELEKAVNDRTKLVSISLVSTINGFQHDLKRVCDVAHAHGAYVYADIVHAAGSLTPLNSKTSMVAFAMKDARTKLSESLKAANVRITVSQHRFRVSVAVFNDINDIDRRLGSLPKNAT